MLNAIANSSIRHLMRNAGKTQQDLADSLGKSLSYVSARFTGRASWELNEITSISHWLGTTEEAILSGDVYDMCVAA